MVELRGFEPSLSEFEALGRGKHPRLLGKDLRKSLLTRPAPSSANCQIAPIPDVRSAQRRSQKASFAEVMPGGPSRAGQTRAEFLQ